MAKSAAQLLYGPALVSMDLSLHTSDKMVDEHEELYLLAALPADPSPAGQGSHLRCQALEHLRGGQRMLAREFSKEQEEEGKGECEEEDQNRWTVVGDRKIGTKFCADKAVLYVFK